ncbi:MAG: sensor histidine kinase [Clostridiaceae bacterium]
MIEIIKAFIIAFIEIGALFVLWDNFRLKEKNNFKINLLIVSIVSIIATTPIATKPILFLIIGHVFMIASVKYFYKKPWVETILEFYIFFFIITILQVAVITCINFVGMVFNGSFIIKLHVTVITLIMSFLICKVTNNKNYLKSIKMHSSVAYCFIVNLATYMIVSNLIWDYDRSLILDNLVIFTVISIAIFSLNMSLYWYISKITEKNKRLEIQKQYQPILKDMIEEIRRKQHDFKNYLNTINGIVEVYDEKELKNQLKNYMKDINTSYKSLEDIVYIENLVLKAAIYNKLCEAERLDIKFSCNIKINSLDDVLKDHEISDVLNNLINNAFEAVAGNEDKNVMLNIFTEDNATIIEVKNNGKKIAPEDLKNIFKRGFSTKGKNRGYGLYNIKKVIEHAGGKIQLSFDNNYTSFKIIFKRSFKGFNISNKTEVLEVSK